MIPSDGPRASLARPAAMATGATLAGALLGALTMAVVAALRGTGPQVDAYYAASTLPNLFMIVVPPAVAPALVPVFADLKAREGEAAAWAVASRFLIWMTLIFTALSLMLWLAAPWIVSLLVAGEAFDVGGSNWQLCLTMLRIQLPNIALSALSGVLAGLHYARKRYVLPSATPLINSAATLLGALALWPSLGIVAVAVGSLLGPLLQVILLAPILREGFRWRKAVGTSAAEPAAAFLDEDLDEDRADDASLRRLFKLQAPIVLAGLVAKAGPLIEAPIATSLGAGSLAVLRFGGQIASVATRILSRGIATTIFPELAEHAARSDGTAFRQRHSLALRYTMLVSMPAVAGMIVLREPMVALLLQRGAFDAASTREVGLVLLGLSGSILAVALGNTVTNALFAQSDTRTPAIQNVAFTLLYIPLALILARSVQPGILGVALAQTITAFLRVAARLRSLRRRIGPVDGRRILDSALRMAAACLPMVWLVQASHDQLAAPLLALAPKDPWRSLALMAELGLLSLLGVIAYWIGLKLLRVPEAAGFEAGLRRALGMRGGLSTKPAALALGYAPSRDLGSRSVELLEEVGSAKDQGDASADGEGPTS